MSRSAPYKARFAKLILFLKMADISASIYIDDPRYYTDERFCLSILRPKKRGGMKCQTLCYKSYENLVDGVHRLVERHV